MVQYYDPFYEPWEKRFAADVQCGGCEEWSEIEGTGFVQSDGDIYYDWTCAKCGHTNADDIVLNVSED